MRYKATFTGRKTGAIGVFYPITTEVEADNEEAARLALYDDYEHISRLKLVDVSDDRVRDWLYILDDGDHDVDAMRTDIANGNLEVGDDERAAEYEHTNIVRESLINGQFTQAREQCESYGLDYAEISAEFKASN